MHLYISTVCECVHIYTPCGAQVYALPQRHKSANNESVFPATNWKGVYITCESSVYELPVIHTYIHTCIHTYICTYILEGKHVPTYSRNYHLIVDMMFVLSSQCLTMPKYRERAPVRWFPILLQDFITSATPTMLPVTGRLLQSFSLYLGS